MLDIKKIEAAINQISSEKWIPKDDIVNIIEAAIKTAYKKDYWHKDEEVKVNLDLESWKIEILVEKTVVKEVKKPALEISFDDLWEDAEGLEEWDTIELDVTDEVIKGWIWESFWRIASQASRQVIIQKIQESEKRKIYELFKNKKWQIINMKVVMVESWKVILDYNWTQVVLPKSEQCSRDPYKADARFYVYVADVSDTEKNWPKVVLSRKRPELVEKLFEMYVPELNDWIVTIENIQRVPWVKTKILVSSEDEEVDPSWTLIWSRWMRVKSVMDELYWEKIDIITLTDNHEKLIADSLKPANVKRVVIKDENKAVVYLSPDERSKAIWKWGSNINLASKLTWYEISLVEE